MLYRYPNFCWLIALVVVCAIPARPAFPADTTDLIREAITHYDQGEFDSAITLLEQVLDREPRNGLAAYELVLTHQAKGDWRSCTKTAKQYLRKLKKEPNQEALLPQISMLQASCHSAAGDRKKALKVFRAALRENPDDYGLNFNIAITLSNEGDYEAAITHLQNAVRADPSHPSPYYVIGDAYRNLGQSVEGLLAYLAFLQREFNTQRTAAAAQDVIDIAYSRVQLDTSGEGTTITLDPTSMLGNPDIPSLTLTLAAAAIASAPDGNIQEPIAESVSDLLATFISIAAEIDLKSDPDSFFVSYLLSGVIDLEQAGVTPAFSYYVLSVAGISGAAEWLDSHSKETDSLIEYFEFLANRRPPGN